MNRRKLLMGAGALTLSACGPSPQGAAQTTTQASAKPVGDPFEPSKLMKDVETYVGFGTHRSGSKSDLDTSDWFRRRWSALGYDIEQPEISVPNADTDVARLEVAGETFNGFAQPPLSFTPEAGVSAPLAVWNSKSPADVSGRIAYVYFPRETGAPSPSPTYRDAFQRCSKAGAVGIVAAVSSASGEVVAINTPVDMLLETPVLMIGEKEKARLDAALAKKKPAKLTISGPGGFRKGKVTIARTGKAGPWVIVSTPQSGWFTCGGERGPGIAMSLALSEWALQQSFPVRWLFVATSGHEWTDYGAELFHKTAAPDPRETALWFHLGASFGARQFDETPTGLVARDTANISRTLMASNDMLPLCQAAFAGQTPIDKPAAADPKTALGEYRLVLSEGYPSSAGFWGFNAHFHTPIDSVDSTTGAVMSPIAKSVAQVIAARLKAL